MPSGVLMKSLDNHDYHCIASLPLSMADKNFVFLRKFDKRSEERLSIEVRQKKTHAEEHQIKVQKRPEKVM